MRPELERLHLIEQHLRHGPVADWPLRQLLDDELAADAATQQQLYRALRAAGRLRLRHELRAIHARLYGPAHGWGWLRALTIWARAAWAR